MPEGTDLLMYTVLVPFAAVFIYGVYLRFRGYGVSNLLRDFVAAPRSRITSLLRYAWLQRKVTLDRASGLMHIPLMYGALVLFIGTALVFIDHDILSFFNEKLLRGPFYLIYEVTLDLFGLLFIIGVSLAILRRVRGLKRLREKNEYYAYLGGLLFIGVSGYLLEALRLHVRPVEWGGYSFVGWTVAGYLDYLPMGPELATGIYQVTWWAHALITFGLVAYLPYSNMLHVFISPLNTMISQIRVSSMTTPFNLAELPPDATELRMGIRTVSDLSWRQRLSLDACTDCGRCDVQCPALAAGTNLSPRMVVQKLKSAVWNYDVGRTENVDFFESGVLTEEEIWACTTCGACVEACPVLIRPLEFIIESRRSIVMGGITDQKITATLTNISRYQNPHGYPQSQREALVRELRELGVRTVEEVDDFEYLYWLGCMSSFDPKAKEIALRMARLMIKAGVKFAIMPVESCTGDPARRMGEEGRYQELALSNIETFKRYGVRKVVTHCPHCFNVIKNEYAELGIELEVVHHSELLAELRSQGKIKPIEGKLTTFHDSCYMSRVNGVTEEPRRALEGVRLVEMRRNRTNSFCCGAGGGNYWYEVRRRRRESHERLEEGLSTGAEVMIVECPFCLAMFEDAARSMGVEGKIEIKDLSEVFE
ncbi:MAG: heterodisulfide reductase-related iron-sulfur binding cluster [Aigarchaeota archaeon]|nr:heterodisulfide reductase-related iron-sulfur binding cluster [Aigarchaeota archaeon]